jgi:hypothetical protein
MSNDREITPLVQALLNLGVEPESAYAMEQRARNGTAGTKEDNQPQSKGSKSKKVRTKDLQNLLLKNAEEADTIHYMNTIFIQFNLPKKNTDAYFFQRNSGKYSYRLSAQPDIGLPYGKWARLLLIYISTQVKLKKSKHIYMGSTLMELGKILQGDISKEVTNNNWRRELLSQLKRLLTTSFTVISQEKNADNNKFSFENTTIADRGEIIFNNLNEWSSSLTLSDNFFKNCLSHSAPIDLRVVNKLKSSYEIDIYCWLCFRLNALTHPITIRWEQLYLQFSDPIAEELIFNKQLYQHQIGGQPVYTERSATEITRALRNFRFRFVEKLKLVSEIYNEGIQFSFDKNTLILIPSKAMKSFKEPVK